MKKVAFLSLILSILACSVIFAQIPGTISLQSYLTDSGGSPVADGQYTIQFDIYDSATDGASLWSESLLASVADGFINVLLGTVNSLDNLNFDKQYYVEISLSGANDYTFDERIELTANPYAFMAKRVESIDNHIPSVATNGQVLKWNGSAWVAANDEIGEDEKGIETITVDDGSPMEGPNITLKAGQSISFDINGTEITINAEVNTVPVGTIVAFYAESSNIPDGWLLCDGSAIASQYTELITLIGTTTPDLRGMFLRGANISRSDEYYDPDYADRTGGTTNQKIGSVQGDQFETHSHNYLKPDDAGNANGTTGLRGFNTFNSTASSEEGGSETRPNNIYVNYIIKAE